MQGLPLPGVLLMHGAYLYLACFSCMGPTSTWPASRVSRSLAWSWVSSLVLLMLDPG